MKPKWHGSKTEPRHGTSEYESTKGPKKKIRTVGLKHPRGYALPNQVSLQLGPEMMQSSLDILRKRRPTDEGRIKLPAVNGKEDEAQARLMSEKHVTQLLNKDDLYKEGDYSDVFLRKQAQSQAGLGIQIHEYDMLTQQRKQRSPVRIPTLKFTNDKKATAGNIRVTKQRAQAKLLNSPALKNPKKSVDQLGERLKNYSGGVLASSPTPNLSKLKTLQLDGSYLDKCRDSAVQ